jgi:hypothetical protein
VFGEYNYNDTIWRTETITINNLSSTYQYIWFRLNVSRYLSAASLWALDDICIEDITPAPAANNCFNFDDSVIGLPAYNQDPIDAFDGVGQYFYNWISTNGSPSVQKTGDFSGFVAASGNQSLIIGACGGNNSEGAAYGYGFQSGRSYQVTFKQRFIPESGNNSYTIDTLNVILANGLVNNEHGGCSPTIPIPAGSDVVFGEYNYNDTIWRTETITINNLSSTYQYIWFRLNVSRYLSAASLWALDDICIEDVTPAAGCFNFDDSVIGEAAYGQDPIEAFKGAGQYFYNWIATNGSPSIQRTGDFPGFVAASGDQSFILGSCGSNQSEGAAYAYGFQAGGSYEVTFKQRFIPESGDDSYTIDTLNVVLANGLVDAEQGGCSATVPIPAGSDVVFGEYNYNDTVWRTETIRINNLSGNYQYIWFRVNTVRPLSAASLWALDDLCIDTLVTLSTCFNFDDSIIGEAAYGQDPIEAFNAQGQYFYNWIATNGSPSIQRTGDFPGFVAASGDQSFILGSCGSNQSEGAAYAYGFQAGGNYQVTFKQRFIPESGDDSYTIDTLNVVLANGLVDAEQGGCSATVPIPAGSDVVFGEYNYNDTVWRTETVNINNLSGNYQYIWFRVNTVRPLSAASLWALDDLCIDSGTALGISQINNAGEIMIYPNPATNVINVVANAEGLNKYTSLSIINMEGQQIEPAISGRNDKQLQINTSQLATGQYVLLLKGQDGIEVRRFTVIR